MIKKKKLKKKRKKLIQIINLLKIAIKKLIN